MPQQVKVTTEDGQSVILTLEDDTAAAPTPSRVGLFTSPLAPEFAKAQTALERAGHPGLTTSVWRARLQGLLSGLTSGTMDVAEIATTPASLAVQLGTAGALRIPAVGALARAPISVPGVTRSVGRALKSYDITKPAKPIGDFLEWLATPSKPAAGTAGAPRLAGKAPTLTEALETVLDELVAPVAAPPTLPVRGAAPGGPQAAADTMRGLEERASQMGRKTLSTLRRGGYQVPEGGFRTSADIARTLTPTPSAVPVNQAMTAVHHASTAAKLKLTAPEFKAASDLVRQGRPAVDVIKAMRALKELQASTSFAGLPTETEVAAAVSEKNVGKSDLARRRAREAADAEAVGNPFR